MNTPPEAQPTPATSQSHLSAPSAESGPAPRLGWSPRRVIALLVGALLTLSAVILLGGGATALWADRTHRDDGYLTSGVHEFSTSGSALETIPTDLNASGTGWLYSPAMLEKVRIKVEPNDGSTPVFVGIASSDDVDRYLAGVERARITDFWSEEVQQLAGDKPSSAPTGQDFWAASSAGTGLRTLTWKPTDGSWTVVVMNADGRAAVHVAAQLEATVPALPWIAAGVLVAGVVVGTGGVLLIVGAVGRSRAPQPRTS